MMWIRVIITISELVTEAVMFEEDGKIVTINTHGCKFNDYVATLFSQGWEMSTMASSGNRAEYWLKKRTT